MKPEELLVIWFYFWFAFTLKSGSESATGKEINNRVLYHIANFKKILNPIGEMFHGHILEMGNPRQ